MTSEMLSPLKPCTAIWLGTHERPIFSFLVEFVHVNLKFLVRFKSQLAQLTDEIATVSLDVH